MHDAVPPAWRKLLNTIKLSLLHTASRDIITIEGVVPFFVRIGDLSVPTGLDEI